MLQEFYVTTTRKNAQPLAPHAARQIIDTYRAWPVHRPDVGDILSASELAEHHRLSFSGTPSSSSPPKAQAPPRSSPRTSKTAAA